MTHNRKFELIREYYGLTQQQVADAIGCTKQTISLFEKGETKNSFVEEFYNHKFLKNLYNKLIADFEPPVDYIEFVIASLSPEELKAMNLDRFDYVDTDSSYKRI